MTEKMLRAAELYPQPDFDEKLSVLDIGCGEGGTLRWLGGKYPEWKYAGVEPSLKNDCRENENGIRFLRGRAEEMPVEDQSQDLALLECVYTRLEDPGKALAEMKRILKPGGKLLISDLYARDGRDDRSDPLFLQKDREGGYAPSCEIGRLPSAAQYIKEFRQAGFSVLEMQDVSEILPGYVGQLIFEEGTEQLEDTLGLSLAYLKERKCGYFYMLASVSELADTVGYAAENSRFYRKKYEGIPLAGITGPASIAKLPFTTPEEVKEDPEDLLCVSPKEIARVITIKSSGSTGIKKRLFFTAEDLEKTADFFNRGIRFLVKPGYRTAVFMEGPTHFSVGGLLQEGLAHLPAETSVYGFIKNDEEAAAQAADADTLIGIPSQLFRLSVSHPELRPKTVLLSGDYVPESVIRHIEAVWKTTVFTHWGMTETGYGGGVQCEARASYHLRDDDLFLEIIDPETGEAVQDGVYGEIVVSTPGRKGMPLIRYRTGDLGAMDTDPCPCGCLKPRLKKVMGRIADSVRLPDGGRLSIEMLDERIYGISGIADYEASYNKQDHSLTIKIKKDSAAEENVVTDGVRNALQPFTETGLHWNICFGDFPASTGTVKRRLKITE
ncbi:MAG: methyltransferase domain-containing protein [Lachnospiraceae bacterium]|nr:methyltransferase domain-containing protein [Lachnospiraceae bacterium]